MSKSIVFFGNEKLATGLPDAQPVIRQALEKAGYQIEAIVTGSTKLEGHESQLAVLAAHGQILDQSILDQFPLGIINIHPSLLPAYRGSTPIEQAILDGVDKTGVSIMKLSSEMDAGPIYKQKSIKLTGSETKNDLATTLQKLGSELLLEVLPGIFSGKLKPRQQSHPERATYTRLLKKSDGQIDWSKPAQQIEREIRAFLGWPGSNAKLFNRDVIITKAHAIPANNPGTLPGYIETIKEIGILMVECGDGRLCIDRVKPAGKKEMSAGEFIRGYNR